MADKVRVGVIGTGGMGSAHTKTLAENQIEEGALVAICDADPKVCAETAERYHVPGFTDYRKLLSSRKVDAVVIATPHYYHPIIGMAALKKGIHVLSEKPIAVTVKVADEFARVAKESGKLFTVMFQARTTPAVRAAQKLIAEGRVGNIYRTISLHTGFRTQAYYDSGEWRATWAGEGGGVLINQAPHALDLFTLLGGVPSRVTAATRTRIHEMEVEDFAHAILEYPNGAMGYVAASTEEHVGTDRVEICGDQGKIVLEGKKLRFWSLQQTVSDFARTSDQVWASPPSVAGEVPLPECVTGHAAVIRNFCRAIQGTEPLLINGADGVKSLELSNAIYMSAWLGKPVDLPLDRSKVERMFNKKRKESQPKARVTGIRETDPNYVKP